MAAANPNSNLVFDFPDPTLRFEFGDGPIKQGGGGGGGSAPAKKGKRFGKFGRGGKSGNCKGNGNIDNDFSPSKQSQKSQGSSSGGTATTASMNSSLNSSLDSGNFGENFFSRRSGSPLKSRNRGGDAAAGPSQRGVGGGSQALFDMAPSPPHQSSPKLTPIKNRNQKSLTHHQTSSLSSSPSGHSSRGSSPGGGQHSGAPSSASTSGYISEVSEFSFDRVTVTTNETGATNQSSNVSWNFLDDNVLDAIGGPGSPSRGDRGNNNTFVPYMSDSNVVSSMGGGSPSRYRNNNTSTSRHRKDTSNGTFSNVSLSDDEDMDNIPFTGIVNDEAQSVISEISERTGGPLEGNIHSGGNANTVKALLREGMESARQRHASQGLTQERRTNVTVTNGDKPSKREGGGGGLAKIKEGGSDASPSRNTATTARSSDAFSGGDGAGSRRSFLEDIQRTYAKFKTDRNGGRHEKSSVLQSIIEDVQFCGLYFCGIDTTTSDDNSRTGDDKYDDLMKRKRDERKRDVDDTFLGKVIQCGNDYGCGDGSAFCVAL